MKSSIIAVGATLLGCMAFPCAAQTPKGITSYGESVDMAVDGSAKVAVTLSVAGLSSDTLELPLNFANVKDVALDPAAIGSARTVRTGDVDVLQVKFGQPLAAPTTFKLSFTADKFFDWTKAKSARGIYLLSYTFSNTSNVNIANYQLRVALPAGFSMRGVTSSTPRATGEEMEPPYDFAAPDGRLIVNLRAKSVPPGRTAAIAFGFVPSGHNPLPAIAIGAIIIALALYLKRGVLTRADYVEQAPV
jgi:hypothetical protein